MDFKILMWNINRANAPQKRKIFDYLKKIKTRYYLPTRASHYKKGYKIFGL